MPSVIRYYRRSYGGRRFRRYPVYRSRYSTFRRFARPLFRSRRTFGFRKRSLFYYATVELGNGDVVRARFPKFGYVKVVNNDTQREFFVKADRAAAYPSPAFSRVPYDAELFASARAPRIRTAVRQVFV